MKTIKHKTIALLLILLGQHGQAQGFVNLDFEDATIVYDPDYGPNGVYASYAIPGWTAGGYSGPIAVLYNTASIGSASVSILDSNGYPPAIDGAYSVYLYGGGTSPLASISQTADVPPSTEAIFFEAQHYSLTSGTGTLQISLGGQSLPFYQISTGPNYTLYGGNIPSVMAGQSEQLIFSVLQGENFWNIDDIQFSSTAIPEPSSVALGALGALLLGFRRWRNAF
jgi:hypothetical protein